ncbi:MAG: GNAT family N-acetyltransferase [Planctomycetota bacterium]|nr:GNAT family N-acetyltransferase [Planctomycetota bacterium]
MSIPALTDLDAEPQHTEAVLRLLRACPPGREHAVVGDPTRMGLEPRHEDLEHCLGVLVLHQGSTVLGTLAICPYSDSQVTIWGPVVHHGYTRTGVGSRLLREARTALQSGGYESIRVLVDVRNRSARSFFLAKGLTVWKDNHVYERSLMGNMPPCPGGVSVSRPTDHDEITRLLADAFPDSGHIERPLNLREREGYRHHILQDSGSIIGACAVKSTPGRAWLTLAAIQPDLRGKGMGQHLIAGVVANEAALGSPKLGLEVLADNAAAITCYRAAGLSRSWTATIMTGPV